LSIGNKSSSRRWKEEGKMVQLLISKTWKPFNAPRDAWTIYHEMREEFPDRKSANNWILATFGKHTRKPMYRDTKTGTKKVGFIIGYKERGDNGKYYMVQDWIKFTEYKEVTP
jgi:hypothetical protein